MKKNKVDVHMADAALGGIVSGEREVVLNNGAVLKAKNVILATGAKARALPGIEPNGDDCYIS